MKRLFVISVVLTLLLITFASPVAAAGGKVRGESGAGDVNQVQVMDPPPFQP
ncbi:MAG: hypothetical protein JW846_06845 [Dehalococcoidia bacterium]|nr:hypothetical protein [Dehalococcoidia bacterium]